VKHTKSIFIVLIFFLILTPAVVFGEKYIQKLNLITPLPSGFVPPPKPTPIPEHPLSILFMGFGGGKHDGTYLTDSMMLTRVDDKTKRAWLVSLPRDLWVSLPISKEATMAMKLNAAFAIGLDDTGYPNKPPAFMGTGGGGEMAKYVVSQVTGQPVDYYLAVSFNGFTKAVDTLGGIDVNVKLPFTDEFYPLDGKEKETCGKSEDDIKAMTATASSYILEQLFTCRYETIKYEAGIQHMDGVNALKYARSRHSGINGGDFSRSNRQREIIEAMLAKIISVNFIPKASAFYNAWKGEIYTDFPMNKIPALAKKYADILKYTKFNTALTLDNVLMETTSKDGQYILAPKTGVFEWSGIKTFLNQQFAATQSGSLKPIPTTLIKK
jgi:polyisoprenyl-teichoic acid--peptidoglycan teichoic acid transferase